MGEEYVLKANFDPNSPMSEEEERIIYCESRGNPKAQNPTSSAFGLGQFLNGTWEYVQNKWDMELEREDPGDQLYAFRRLYFEEGNRHWLESKKCWNPTS